MHLTERAKLIASFFFAEGSEAFERLWQLIAIEILNARLTALNDANEERQNPPTKPSTPCCLCSSP